MSEAIGRSDNVSPAAGETLRPRPPDRPRPGHPFHARLNEVLAAAGFAAFVGEQCAPCDKEGGGPGIPPGAFFRMLSAGCFEGIEGRRGIAWRCADSLALRTFLGFSVTEGPPATFR